VAADEGVSFSDKCEKRTVELKTNNEGNIVVAKVL